MGGGGIGDKWIGPWEKVYDGLPVLQRHDGEIKELDERLTRLENQLRGRDLGDEDDSHDKKPWWKRLFD